MNPKAMFCPHCGKLRLKASNHIKHYCPDVYTNKKMADEMRIDYSQFTNNKKGGKT